MKHTTTNQDNLISKAEDLGNNNAFSAEAIGNLIDIIRDLDDQLTEAKSKIEELEQDAES